MKLITKPIAQKLITAYQHSAETGEGGTDIVAKFFTPWANATWFITEGMPLNSDGEPVDVKRFMSVAKDYDAYDWHLFGFCDLGDVYCAELGYVLLSELQSLNGPFGLRVERDRHFTASLNDILQKYEHARYAA